MTTTPPLAVAAALAWGVFARAPSRRRRTIAEALTGLLAVNVGRAYLDPWPTLDLAAFASWYALTAGAAWSVLAGEHARDQSPPAEPGEGEQRQRQRDRSPRHAWIILTLACLASAALAVRFGYVAELPRASFALSLAAQFIAALRFLSRGGWPDDAQRVALILAASSLADVAGPWLAGCASRDWNVGRWPAVITWICIATLEARCLTRVRSGPGTS